jgi:peptide chain release factor 2
VRIIVALLLSSSIMHVRGWVLASSAWAPSSARRLGVSKLARLDALPAMRPIRRTVYSQSDYESTYATLMDRFKIYNDNKINDPSLREQHEQVKMFEEEFKLVDDLFADNDETGGDAGTKSDCQDMLLDIDERFQKYRRETVLNRPHNKGSDCFVEISAGAGGEDAFDWVNMLLDMYAAWTKNEGFKSSVVSTTQGDGEKGLRYATLKVTGSGCYAWMKAEAGVHRLVRISPFDSQGKRHTSFAQVIVYPNVESAGSMKNFQVSESDIRLDTFRSSGAGGQSVQKTDSAVRLTHVPTGIVVQCQNERSQHQNKAFAMNILKSKLLARELERAEKFRQQSMTGVGDNSWGNQIKSVVLNPYQLVKDHRSKWESSNVQSYLSGGRILTESIENNFDYQFDHSV